MSDEKPQEAMKQPADMLASLKELTLAAHMPLGAAVQCFRDNLEVAGRHLPSTEVSRLVYDEFDKYRPIQGQTPQRRCRATALELMFMTGYVLMRQQLEFEKGNTN